MSDPPTLVEEDLRRLITTEINHAQELLQAPVEIAKADAKRASDAVLGESARLARLENKLNDHDDLLKTLSKEDGKRTGYLQVVVACLILGVFVLGALVAVLWR